MVRRSGRRTADPDAPVLDLDRVLADDAKIDAITGRPPDGGRQALFAATHRQHGCAPGEMLFDLFGEWRAELAQRPLPPAPVLPRQSAAVAPTRPARSMRAMLAVAAAIGAVVVGSAGIGAAHANPGSPLWPITRAIWPDRAASADSARAVLSSLDEAKAALVERRTLDAQVAIDRAADELLGVAAGDERDAMHQAVVDMKDTANSSPQIPPGAGSSSAVVTPSVVAPTSNAAVAPHVESENGEPVAFAAPEQSNPIEGVAGNRPPGAPMSATSDPTPAGDPSAVGEPTEVGGPTAEPSTPPPAETSEPVGSTPAPGTESDPPSAAPTLPPPGSITAAEATTEPAQPSGSTPVSTTEQSAPSPTATSPESEPTDNGSGSTGAGEDAQADPDSDAPTAEDNTDRPSSKDAADGSADGAQG